MRISDWSSDVCSSDLPDFGLHVTAFAHGDAEQAQLVARYRLENTTDRPRAYTLALDIRPLQVNPPTQFLSTVGGVSRIDSISVGPLTTELNGETRLFARAAPAARFASTFDHGMAPRDGERVGWGKGE